MRLAEDVAQVDGWLARVTERKRHVRTDRERRTLAALADELLDQRLVLTMNIRS